MFRTNLEFSVELETINENKLQTNYYENFQIVSTVTDSALNKLKPMNTTKNFNTSSKLRSIKPLQSGFQNSKID